MMKTSFFTIFLFFLCSNFLFAENKIDKEKMQAAETYQRLFESAHPTPIGRGENVMIPMVVKPLMIKNPYAIFQDVNTIVDNMDPGDVQNESSIAVNPKNPKNLIASSVDYRDFSSTWVYVSHDGGKTWNNINLSKPDPEWRTTNDPSVAFDPDGNAYLVYGGSSNREIINGVLAGENAVFIAKSTDEGYTWKAHTPIIIHTGQQTLDSTFEDKYYISVDNVPTSPNYKHLYVPWKRVTPRDSATQIVLSKSTDGGATWSFPVEVSDRLPGSSEDTTFGQSFPLASTGPNGEVYVVWNHGIEHGVGFARSFDGGASFVDRKIIQNYEIFGTTTNIGTQMAPVFRHTVKGKVRAETYPTIVTDTTDNGRKGTIYVCYAGGSIPDIFFTKSTDQGDTWTTPIRVNQDETNDQFWSWMSLDPMTGDLAIMYFSSARDPENILVECWVAYSSDGGETWTERPAAEYSGDLRNNPFQRSVFAGDYSGCAFYDGMIYPSWVDMRSGDMDNDVYTAIINVNAPMPVDNFAAVTVPEMKESVKLTWDLPEPMTRSFGQELATDDFKFNLFKEGKFLTELASSEREYIDGELEPYERYRYSIKVVSGDDESGEKSDSAYAGGSRLPGKAEIVDLFSDSDAEVVITAKLPKFRDDGTTIFLNMKKIKLWRDGEVVQTLDIESSEAGKEIQLTDTPDERGYYHYAITVLDDNDPPNESPMSNDMYVYFGKIEVSYLDNFAGGKFQKYLINGDWAVVDNFSNSEGYSLHESPDGDYDPKSEYIVQLFPLVTDNIPEGKTEIIIKFDHACIVYRNDDAYLEINIDGKWSEIARWTQEDYAPWGDGELTSEDWKTEEFNVEVFGGMAYLRFRLESNSIREDDGWYIDNISYQVLFTSVDGKTTQELKLFPNPAWDYLKIDISSIGLMNIDKVSLFDIFGNKLEGFGADFYENEILIKTDQISNGVYYLALKTKSGRQIFRKFSVVK